MFIGISNSNRKNGVRSTIGKYIYNLNTYQSILSKYFLDYHSVSPSCIFHIRKVYLLLL